MRSPDFDHAAYLLGELPPEEMAAAERRLREDPELRERVERLRPVVSRLEQVPPEAWQDLTPPPMPPLPGAAPARRRQRLPALTLRPLAAGAAGLALVAAGLGAGLLVAGGDDQGDAARGPSVTLTPPDGSAPGTRPAGTAATVGDGPDRRLQVEVSGLSSSGAGGFYEVWLLGAEGELVSLGSFKVPPSGATTVTVPLPADPGRYGSIDVSREPADGDPAHSKDSVLRGTAL